MWSEVDRECGGLSADWAGGIVGWSGSRDTRFNPWEVTCHQEPTLKSIKALGFLRQRNDKFSMVQKQYRKIWRRMAQGLSIRQFANFAIHHRKEQG